MSQTVRDVVVVDGRRTAIGTFSDFLRDVPTITLAATVTKAAIASAGVEPNIGHVAFGSVVHGEARDMLLSRVAAVEAGVPIGTPALSSRSS